MERISLLSAIVDRLPGAADNLTLKLRACVPSGPFRGRPKMDAMVERRFGRFVIQPGRRQLLIDGRPAKIGSRASDILMALVERRQRVVTKDELLDLVWPQIAVEESNLQVHVMAL